MTYDKKESSENFSIKQKISILDLISDSNYRTYNIIIARYLESVNAAIILSELVGRYQYHLSRNELTEDGWFYLTHESIEHRTMLTRREQDSAINILTTFGVIEKKLIGLPAKRHFKINELKILEMLNIDTNHPSLYKNAKLGCTSKNIDPLYKQDCTKTPNCIGGKRQTSHIIEEPKEEPKIKNVGTGVPVSADADDLLSFFIQKLKERKPDIKIPEDPKRWLLEIERMIRIDKRDPKKIKAMIDWIHRDSFWSTTILSPEKLRKQYDQIELQALGKYNKNTILKNQQYAENLRKKYPQTYGSLLIASKYVRNMARDKEISLNLPFENFKRAFASMFGVNYDDMSPNDK